MRAWGQYVGVFFLGLGAVACGSKNTPNSSGYATSGPAAGAPAASSVVAAPADHMAQQSVQSADDAGASSAATHASPAAAKLAFDEFGADAFLGQPALGAGLAAQVACLGNISTALNGNVVTVNISYTGGTCKRGGRTQNGNETIFIDRSANSLSINSNMTTTFANGDTLYASNTNPNNYAVSIMRTGRPADGNVTLQTSFAMHRVRSNAKGTVLFDHTVTTPTNMPLTVVNSYGATGLGLTVPLPTQRTLNGSVAVHHNLIKMSAVNVFTNLTHDLTSTCACPSSGTLSQTVTYDADNSGYTRVYQFTGCGTATVTITGSTRSDTANGNSAVTWDSCQG
jgi:hypothetical protein